MSKQDEASSNSRLLAACRAAMAALNDLAKRHPNDPALYALVPLHYAIEWARSAEKSAERGDLS